MKKPVLIDAVFINLGGGLTLFNHFLSSIDDSIYHIYLLLDKRIKNKILNIPNSYDVLYITGSIFKRHFFYLKHRESFKKVLCFASIPPSINLKCSVYTYFHQYLYISLPKELNCFDQIKWYLKRFVFKRFIKNTDKWFVQSLNVKNQLIKKFRLQNSSVNIYPIFSQNEYLQERKTKNKFVYVSYPYPYKNHKKLIEAFASAFKQCKVGELHLTIDENNDLLINLIKDYKSKGIPIFNHGIIDKQKIHKLYANSEYLIFPSLMESFGLPIVEAIELGCKIIVSDLPFANSICKPSLVFNPNDKIEIAKTILFCNES